MSGDSQTFTFKRQFITAVFIPIVIGVMMILSFVLEKGMGWDFHRAGVYPRRIENIWGIFTLVFVHADWSHLANNVISFTILSSFLYYFYRQLASKILVVSYVFSGLILWVIGRDNWHVGASGLIYALAFFLFFSGVIRRYIPLIAISLIVALIYGNMIWHIFPWELRDPVSWEGHLSGGIVGVILSLYYRNEGPRKPIKVWEEEDEDNYTADMDDDYEIEGNDNKKVEL
ncbi:MAG: rhomboid family intramembrane serine protease [Paludibacter sp.]